MNYIPCWKDKDGNRFVVLAKNHVFPSWNEAFQFQAADFIFYIPFGLKPDGILELEVDAAGKTNLPHIPAGTGNGLSLALIAGPAFEKVVEAKPMPT